MRRLLGLLLLCAALSCSAADSRALSKAQQQWLSRLAQTANWSSLGVRQAPALPTPFDPQTIKAQELPAKALQLRPLLTRLTLNQPAQGVVLSQSGVVLTLPALPAQPTQSSFNGYLQQWLTVDLSDLIVYLKAAQSELGWSDYELIALLASYATKQYQPPERQAFAAAFAMQADFAVRLWRNQQQFGLLLRLKNTPQFNAARAGDRYWYSPFTRLSQDQIRVSSVYPGQSLRLLSLHDRLLDSETETVSYQLPAASKASFVNLVLPAHWQRLSSAPLALADELLQPQPDWFYQAMADWLPATDAAGKMAAFAQFIADNFTPTEQAISWQQALLAGQTSIDVRFFWFAGFWYQLTRGSAAVIDYQNRHYLALSADADLNTHSALLRYRDKYWHVWDDELRPVSALTPFTQAQWQFLP